MGVSILYLVLFAPASPFCWFLSTYYAYKRDSSLAFMWIFFILFFQGLSFVLNAIGISKLGAAGYFNGAQFFQDEHTEQKTVAGGMYIIMGFLWLIGIRTSPRSGHCNENFVIDHIGTTVHLATPSTVPWRKG